MHGARNLAIVAHVCGLMCAVLVDLFIIVVILATSVSMISVEKAVGCIFVSYMFYLTTKRVCIRAAA